MYPDHPDSPSDLVPLPRCDGPKLEPFDFKGPREIKFLKYLGRGLYAHVFKVMIRGKLYALKLFRFIPDVWAPISEDTYRPDDLEALRVFADYSEPFNCECRAYGRLRESGHEDLAVRCYGYVLLGESSEAKLMKTFKKKMFLTFNGHARNERQDYKIRARFRGKDSRLPPIRGILKELGRKLVHPTENDFKTMRRTIVSMQQLGILRLDIDARQFIDGKLADFSMAITTPHFMTNPEVNSELTAEWKSAIEYETFRLSCGDYWEFDEAVYRWNRYERDINKQRIRVDGFPGGRVHRNRYNLRSTPRRDGLYTYVDPRLYDLKRAARRKKEKETGSTPRKHPRVKRNPPLWHYKGEPKFVAMIKRAPQFGAWLAWDLLDGKICPTRSEKVRLRE